ncbi:MAG: glycosyltransferase family 2 protein [Marinilabiliaceae bacterium]|nr:glycosyltransferase family 2 protein [Marinilabiliaceae bacterium]
MLASDKTIGVVISTYNNPKWLEKTLWGYMYQSRLADEIIIADDGSDDTTRELIQRFSQHLPIRHVWHEDLGFRKSTILNKAIVEATADYLIFTDQDCVPRADFVAIHARYAKTGYMLSGGYFKLPMNISNDICEEDIANGNAFTFSWLKKRGLSYNFKALKYLGPQWFCRLMNNITTTKASWNGCNSSGWRDDMIKINGYNEDMHYGGQDREFGERLHNMGIRSKQIRYSALTLHLDHPRPYKTAESIKNNLEIRRNTRSKGIVRTPHGITKIDE